MLIKCEECNKEVSDKATACPSCGNPINVNAKSEDVKEVITEKVEYVSKNDYDKCTKCKTALEQKENNKCLVLFFVFWSVS